MNPDELITGIHNVQLAAIIFAGTGVAWFLIVWLIDQWRGTP